MDYGDNVRYANHRLALYRRGRTDYRHPEEDSNARDLWMNAELPMREPPRIFPIPEVNQKAPRFYRLQKPTRERWQNFQTRIRLIQSWFAVMPHGRFQFKRNLGAGGQGLTMQFKYTDPIVYPEGRDFVLKASVLRWEDAGLRREEDWAMKMRRNAHIVQSIDPEEFGLPPRRKYEFSEGDADYKDSSEDESSGTDSEREKRPPKRKPTRRELNAQPEILQHRREIKRFRRQAAKDRHKKRMMKLQYFRDSRLDRYIQGESLPPLSEEDPGDDTDLRRLDYLLLEYMENSDLNKFLQRLQEAGRGPIPNRVLWAFWLCLVRSCIAMAYPVNKFHPDRHAPAAGHPEDQNRKGRKRQRKRSDMPTGRGYHDQVPPNRELLEEIPRGVHMRNRAKPIVHFDIDPQNILIGPVEVPDAHVPEWRRAIAQKKLADAMQKLELNRSKLLLDVARMPERFRGFVSALPLTCTEGAPNTTENRLSAIDLSFAAQHPEKAPPSKDAILQRMRDDDFEEQFSDFAIVLELSEMRRIGDPDLDRVTFALLLVARAQGQSIRLLVARGTDSIYAYPAPNRVKGRLEGLDLLISLVPQDGQARYVAMTDVRDGDGWDARQQGNSPQGNSGMSEGEYEDVAIGMDPNPFRHPGDGIIADPEGLRRRIMATGKYAEHALAPRLKMADFGLAQLMKPQKKNSYYERVRLMGKTGYLAPEQFCHEWETIPDDPDGPEVSEASVAGQYGPATNIWGIALTMWQVITGYYPTLPPWPQDPANVEWEDGELAAPPTGPINRPGIPRDNSGYRPGLRGGRGRPFSPTPEPFPRTPEPFPRTPEPFPRTPVPFSWTPEPFPPYPETLPPTPELLPATPRPLSATSWRAEPAQQHQVADFPQFQPGYLPSRNVGTPEPIAQGMDGVPAPLFAGRQNGNQQQYGNQPQNGDRPQYGNQPGAGIYDAGGGVRTPPMRAPQAAGPAWAGFTGPAGPRPPPPPKAPRQGARDQPGTPISYCSLLLDPQYRREYRWADRDLRRTIFQCMYHRPKDRPTLQTLLAQAKYGAAKSFPGESDDMVRAWVLDMFHNPLENSAVGP